MVTLHTQSAQKVQPALEIKDLEKSFGEISVLRGITLDMQQGEFLVLVGPSGCGKSTLLNCIAGLEEVTGGEIIIDGREVTQLPPRERDIAMVFQSYALYPTMTVAQNIAFGMKVRHIPKEARQSKTLEVAKILQIEHLLERKPGHLSGGQRQRVAMGRALVRDPKLFLFDEPLSNLDAKLRVEMRSEIKALHERLHASIVYVTHDQIEAMTLGTRIVVLKDGHVHQIGTPAEIYNRPANLFVADFMGSPPMNLIKGRLRIEGAMALCTVGSGAAEIVWQQKDPSDALKGFEGKDVILGIRPEAFTLSKTDKASFVLEVARMENAGSDIFASLDFGGHFVAARLPGHVTITSGAQIEVHIDDRNVCFFDPESEMLIAS